MRRVYWWGEVSNFGDQLNGALLEHFGIEYAWSVPRDADLLLCGSYLDGHDERCGGPRCRYHLPWQGWTGTIIGTGRLFAGRQPQDLSEAKIYAVRGPLTASEFGLQVAYGDPGLAVPVLARWPSEPPRWEVSYVPHWSDAALIHEARDRGAHIIDVRARVGEVAQEIAQSGSIVASSLHGVIVADAYGIPAEPRLCRRAQEREGGDFKWQDYHGSLDLEPDFGTMREAPRDRVEMMRGIIVSALESLPG